ncbi:MAG: penicillin-binding protein activator, partial [Alphaproteobacteria bacterium]
MPLPSTAAPGEQVMLTRPPGVRKIKRVGLLVPLSGSSAPLGRALLNAAQLALFDLAGDDFVLVPRDTRGTPEGAARAAEELIDEGVGLILGPLFAPSVEAVAPAARAEGINVVAFSNDYSVAGDGVFITGFMPEMLVARIVTYAHSRGISRFAALLPDTVYGTRVADA